MEKAKILEALGLKKNWVYETIVSSYLGEKPHAAPMGIRTRDHEHLTLEIYKSSATCASIILKKAFTVNFTCDVSLFYDAVYRRDALLYGRGKKVDAPFLAQADAYLEIEVSGSEDIGDRMRFTGKIAACSYCKKDGRIKLLNRGDALALEALITASKIPYVTAGEKEALSGEIKRICRVVSRVAPGSAAEELVCGLSSYL